MLIGETETNDPSLVRSRARGGTGLEGIWADDLHHTLHVSLTGERDGYYGDYDGIDDVVNALERGMVYDGRWSPVRERTVGASFETTERHRLVTCLQNHDQVGNRAGGERLHHLVGVDAVCAGAAVSLLAATTPLLFMGEEWAASTPFPYFVDHQDAELAEAVRTGRRGEFVAFGWEPEDVPDPQATETATSAILQWEERNSDEHAEVLDWYRTLLALRRSHPCRRVVARRVGSVLEIRRGAVVAWVNLSAASASIPAGIGGDVLAERRRSGDQLGPWGVLVAADALGGAS